MLGTLDIDAAAKKAAGNWQRFTSFFWFRERELDDPEKWAIIYTHNRDSGLLDQSNSAAIQKALKPFTDGDEPNVVMESHNHWAVGHVDGFSIRVFDQHGEITPAFRAYHTLAERLDDYPILDETDYSNREYEATLSNLTNAAWRLKNEFALSEGWEFDAYSWLSHNDPSEIENRDDHGGYPSEESLQTAFESLSFEPAT